jgi:hypothetical protein
LSPLLLFVLFLQLSFVRSLLSVRLPFVSMRPSNDVVGFWQWRQLATLRM